MKTCSFCSQTSLNSKNTFFAKKINSHRLIINHLYIFATDDTIEQNFISKSYISKGQFTSYLKKFNVNPNGHYAVYNHQYMANLRAPMSEASSTYNSISKNNLLNNSINFVIPQFDNMPESTYDANIKDTGRGTADIQDETFEASIAGFNETYKP